MDSVTATRAQLVRVKILAYLGQLKKDEFVAARKLVLDLDLRYTTAKNVLEQLEERGYVQKIVSNHRGVFAKFRLDPGAYKLLNSGSQQPFVPPEWEDAYGRHPYAP